MAPLMGKDRKRVEEGHSLIMVIARRLFATRRFEDFKRAGINGMGILLDTTLCFTYRSAITRLRLALFRIAKH